MVSRPGIWEHAHYRETSVRSGPEWKSPRPLPRRLPLYKVRVRVESAAVALARSSSGRAPEKRRSILLLALLGWDNALSAQSRALRASLQDHALLRALALAVGSGSLPGASGASCPGINRRRWRHCPGQDVSPRQPLGCG